MMRTAFLINRPGQQAPRVLASLNGLLSNSVQKNKSSTSRTFSSLVSSSKLNNRQNLASNMVLPAFTNSSLSVMFKSTTARDEDEDSRVANKKNKALTNERFSFDFGVPDLIPEWKKMFNKDTLFQDISAGLTVGCIAVPLSLAIAVASGVPAEVGLITAAVSGIAGGMMGGTTLAVTGPAAAISLLVVGAVHEHGLEALPFITLACGGLQLASGITRVGVVAKLVPVSVIAGFTTGVGTLILSGQVPKALGMTAPDGLNPVEIMGFIGENLSTVNPAAAALAFGTSAAMLALPKLHPKIPSALLAVGGATIATHTCGLDVSLIGAIPSGFDAFHFGLPTLPSVGALPSLGATVFLIYAMTSVESLLSCAALDKMKKTDYKYNSNQELVGQGLANMGSAMFMGMPVTSVIARSGLNVKLGAQTRLPALVQASFVFSSVVFMSDTIAMIPMPALSGMLITTGIGMLNPTEFKHCFAVQKLDTVPFLATIGGMVTFGLAEGIGIGCASALAMNFVNNRNSLDTTRMQFHEEPPTSAVPSTTAKMSINNDMGLPSMMPRMQVNEARGLHTMVGYMHQPGDDHTFEDCGGQDFDIDHTRSTVWQINGPINFVSMFEIENMVRRIKERKEDSPVGTIVVDMHGVTSLEFTGVEELVNRLVEVADGTPVKMVNCDNPIQIALDQVDPNRQIARFSKLSASPSSD